VVFACKYEVNYSNLRSTFQVARDVGTKLLGHSSSL